MVAQKELTNLDTPEFAIPDAHRIPPSSYPADMMSIPPSRMFEIKESLQRYLAKAGDGAVIYDASQGDGGASLPGVPVEVLETAAELQIEHGTGYDKPFGTALFRQVSAEQYWKLEGASGWGPENIIFTQGGRDGLNKAYNAMITLGTKEVGSALVVSRVPWLSYCWGSYNLGLNAIRAPGRPEEGWRFTPETIRATVDFAAKHGRKVGGIIITSPDNPTGRTLSVSEQVELGQAALDAGIAYVLYDWMYHWVTDGGPTDINQVLQAFTPEDRKRLMFLDGITKSLGASNVRSAQLLADANVIKQINSKASHGLIPSFYAQAVAISAYRMGFEKAAAGIIEPCKQSRRVLRAALEARQGEKFIMGDGYYAFIDLTRYIENSQFEDSADLGAWMGETFGVVGVPGAYFSDAGGNWMRFSYALPPEKTEKAVIRFFEALDSLV